MKETRERMTLVFEEMTDHGRPRKCCLLTDGTPDNIFVTPGTRHFDPTLDTEYDCDVVFYTQGDGRKVGKAYRHEATPSPKPPIVIDVTFRENRGGRGIIAYDDYGPIVVERGYENKITAGEKVHVRLRETPRLAYATPVAEKPVKETDLGNPALRDALMAIEPSTAKEIELQEVSGKVGVVVRSEADVDTHRKLVSCYELLGVRSEHAPYRVIEKQFSETIHGLQEQLATFKKQSGTLIDQMNIDYRIAAVRQAYKAAATIAKSHGDSQDRKEQNRGHQQHHDRNRHHGKPTPAAIPAKVEAETNSAPAKTEGSTMVYDGQNDSVKPVKKPQVETLPKVAKPKKPVAEGQTLADQLADLQKKDA